MLKFRFVLLLSVALMSSGYRWRCYAFCDEQTAVQNDYTEQRDDCRGFAQDNIDAEMAKTPNPNSVKARKIKLIALFSDCMAQYGWDVPKVNDKGTKFAEVPLYESTVSKVAAADNNPDSEVVTTPAPNTEDQKVTEQDLPARKTPVGNIQKQKETETLNQENSNNTNTSNTAVQRSANNKATNNKSQNTKTQIGNSQPQNVQTQPATSKSKKAANTNSINTGTEQNQQKTLSTQSKSASQKASSSTNSSTNNRIVENRIVEKSVSKEQDVQPVAAPQQQPSNSTSYRRVVDNKSSTAKTATDASGYGKNPELEQAEATMPESVKSSANPTYTRTTNSANNSQITNNNRDTPMGELSPEAGRYKPTPDKEAVKSNPNPTYTRITDNVSNQQTTDSSRSLQTKEDFSSIDKEQSIVAPKASQNAATSNQEFSYQTTNAPASAKNSSSSAYMNTASSTDNSRSAPSSITTQETNNNAQQAALSNNRTQTANSNNSSESTNRIITEKESIERITNSQQSDRTSNVTTATAAATPPAAAGVLAAGGTADESAIPTQPRVTNNTSKQRTTECEFARRSAPVSEAAARKAKECDMECARQRKTMPETVTPPACPIKDPAVNVLDLQLRNKP
jgi:hypothetical protein